MTGRTSVAPDDRWLPVRLTPGDDLREALRRIVVARSPGAAYVVAGIGSLSRASLRFAGRESATSLAGPLEIVSLAGSLGADGAHLHMVVSDADGRVTGGHVGIGNEIRTTAEILIARVSGWRFAREHDARTGYLEWVVTRATTDDEPRLVPPGRESE